MKNTEKSIDLNDFNSEAFEKEGLYLILEDSTVIDLTKDNIKKTADRFWSDSKKIPDEVKKAAEFEFCSICPARFTATYCHAIWPSLPFIEIFDKFKSIDKVTAVYKESDKPFFYITFATMQEALKYIASLSLTHFCEIGRQYLRYFTGTTPFQSSKEITRTIYLNMFYYHQGDREEVKKTIERFSEELRITTSCQVTRMNLICQNDALANALVNVEMVGELLALCGEDVLGQELKLF